MNARTPFRQPIKNAFSPYILDFFAENKREHTAERGKAKELTVSLIRGLRKDKAQLNRLSAIGDLQTRRVNNC